MQPRYETLHLDPDFGSALNQSRSKIIVVFYYTFSQDRLFEFNRKNNWKNLVANSFITFECLGILYSVADPGSGAFLTPGSGIRDAE